MKSKLQVLKYKIEVDAHREGFYIVEVDMPKGANPISCGAQPGYFTSRIETVSIWATAHQNVPVVLHRFGVLGTGVSEVTEEELAEGKFLGTVINGPAVWHIFDLGEKDG